MLLFVCLCIGELQMFINLDSKITGLEPMYITDTPKKIKTFDFIKGINFI
jgi:hypothetical protein